MSQIATTIEQSKQLLLAGIDPRSSDMKWTNIEPDADDGGYYCNRESDEYHLDVGQPYFELNDESIPAWSLSKLIDLIAETGVPMNYGPMKDSASVLDHAVNALDYQLRHANH